jgi:hypothetical protein
MHRAFRAVWVLLCAAALLGCDAGSGGGADGGGDSTPAVKPEVQIGTSNEDNLDFIPLDDGDDVPLRTFGQGGTHAAIAVRCIGFGNVAFVDVDIENIDENSADMGKVISSVKMTRPALLLCRDDEQRVCDDLPLNVMTGGLADPGEKDGLHIRITAKVHNPKGATAHATLDAVLRKDFDGGLPSG